MNPQTKTPSFEGGSVAFASMLDLGRGVCINVGAIDVRILPVWKSHVNPAADTLRKKPLGLYGLAGESTPWTNRNPCTVNCDPGAVPSLTTRPPLGELMSTSMALTWDQRGKMG